MAKKPLLCPARYDEFACTRLAGHPDNHESWAKTELVAEWAASPESLLPLYLNAEECSALQVAVGLALNLLNYVRSNQPNDPATFGQELPRADQAQAIARDHLPILRSLNTALVELGYSLERTGE